MVRFSKKQQRAIMLVILLLPTILFTSTYAVGSATGTRFERYSPAPADWTVNMTLTHPGFVVPGQPVPLTVKVGISILNANYSVGIIDMAVELRHPTSINSTTGVVKAWSTLSTSEIIINQNFTKSTTITKVATLTIASPPGNGPSELFIPVSDVAFNGVVDLNIYQQSSGSYSAAPQSLSLIDTGMFYRSQLSSVISTSSWLTYQLISALVFAFLFVRTRTPTPIQTETTYSKNLWRFQEERMLAHLEELKDSGKIGPERYSELKQEYQRGLNGPGS